MPYHSTVWHLPPSNNKPSDSSFYGYSLPFCIIWWAASKYGPSLPGTLLIFRHPCQTPDLTLHFPGWALPCEMETPGGDGEKVVKNVFPLTNDPSNPCFQGRNDLPRFLRSIHSQQSLTTWVCEAVFFCFLSVTHRRPWEKGSNPAGRVSSFTTSAIMGERDFIVEHFVPLPLPSWPDTLTEFAAPFSLID